MDRVTGALLGVHCGDSLGATVEFESWASVREKYPDGVREIVGGGHFRWPAGHATDDTDLTRAVLLAYVDPGDDVVLTAARRMLDWYHSGPRDIGRATATGLLKFAHHGDPRTSGAGPGQAGNGSLMRCIPTALWVQDRDRRIRESMEISAITHNDPRCTIACAAYNEIVAALVAGAPAAAAVSAGIDAATELGNADVVAALQRRLDLPACVQSGQTGLPNDGRGFVLDSLSLAIAAVLDPRPFADVLIDVVRLGNDADTNAAIAGGLLGARDGVGAIPAQWRSVLQFGDEFTRYAAMLH